MPFLRTLLIVIVFCSPAIAGRAQSPNWKSLKHGKLNLIYPPTWHESKESNGQLTRVTLTPDSMQNMTMRMFEIGEIPLDDAHTFANFKQQFVSLLQANMGSGDKILKNEEITFKNHKCMYAEILESGLPKKIYGIDDGNVIYLVLLYSRRYIKIADPGLERDGAGILNSINLDQ